MALTLALVIGWQAPAGAAPAGPATPTALSATNGMTSISLTWRQPATGARPVSFRVYEVDAGAGSGVVVARNTTTYATIANLGFGSTHTYRVTAVDAAGRESAPSAPVTRQAFVGGVPPCGGIAPSSLTVTALTASAVSLAWSNEVPQHEVGGPVVVLRDGEPVIQTTLDSARIGGLAPGTAYGFQVARRDCHGQTHPSQAVTVTTPDGPSARPAAPTGLAAGTRTTTTIALTWTAVPLAAAYRVYEGGVRVATTSTPGVVLRGLWRDTGHQYTVAAVDAAGSESAQSAPTHASTQPCPESAVPAPTALTAVALSASSVRLSWTQVFPASSFTVYRLGAGAPQPIATTRVPSTMVTGLPSATTARFAVAADATACGPSGMSAPATVTTAAGPAARPAAPTGLSVVSQAPNFDFTGTVTLGWVQPPGGASPVAYRLYEGASLFATTSTTGVTLRLPGGPTHQVTAVAVDAAGNESAPSAPVVFTVPFFPPP